MHPARRPDKAAKRCGNVPRDTIEDPAAESRPAVSLGDLEHAQLWVSTHDAFELCANVSRTDGKVYCTGGDHVDESDVFPDDLGDPECYACVPSERDFDLGTRLVVDFARQHLPADNDYVRDVFHRRGAYAKWEALLDRRGMLDRWHQHHTEAAKQALIEWAIDQGFQVVRP